MSEMPSLRDIRFYVTYIPSEEVEALLVGKSEEERREITRQDYEKNHEQRQLDFRLQTRNISSFYSSCLKGHKNDQCSRINIECRSNSEIRSSFGEGFYVVFIPYDIDDFFKLDDLGKKKKTLELIDIATAHIIEKEGWDRTIFDEAHHQIVNNDYMNRWIWKKPKNSPNRKYLAKVFGNHGLYSCDIGIIIEDKNGQIMKQEVVVSEKPEEWAFLKYLGDLKWISGNEVVLIGKDGDSEFHMKVG